MKKTLVECLVAFLCVSCVYDAEAGLSSGKLSKLNSNKTNNSVGTGASSTTQTSGAANSSSTPNIPTVLPSQPAVPTITPLPDQTTATTVPDQTIIAPQPDITQPQPDTPTATLPSLGGNSGLSQSTPDISYIPPLEGTTNLTPDLTVSTPNIGAFVNWSAHQNAKQLINEATTISNFNKKLSKYLRYFGHIGKKLPITKQKIDTNVSKRIKPLFDFTKALASKLTTVKSTEKKKNTALNKLNFTPTDEYEMVAIRQAALLLNNEAQINTLPEKKRDIARSAAGTLLKYATEKGLTSDIGL